MNPEAVIALVIGAITIILLLIRGVVWIVSRITDALESIRKSIDGVKAEVSDLRTDIELVTKTADQHGELVADHESRLRQLEAERERPRAGKSPARSGRRA